MLLQRIVSGARRRRSVDALVRLVAEQSLEVVCRLVADRVTAMTVCEARGYVRARAVQEVRRQTRAVIAQRQGIDPAWESTIVVRAAERVSPLALRQLASARLRSASHQPRAVSRCKAA